MSRQSRQNQDVATRIDKLEAIIKLQGEQLSKLYALTSKMKTDFENSGVISRNTRAQASRLQAVYGVSDRMPNPWALETSRSLTQAMTSVDNGIIGKRMRRLFEVYKPTLEVLRSNPKGLTADKVGEKTERSRNIESTYLWRLFLAGYATRERKKRKVVYKIKKGVDLTQVFGREKR